MTSSPTSLPSKPPMPGSPATSEKIYIRTSRMLFSSSLPEYYLHAVASAPFSELTAASSAVSHSTSQINKTILYAQERRARRAVEDAAANAE